MSDKSIQDQIGMADSFEEALRLITENPPKPEAKYNRQPVNMSLIKVDPERLQSRVETSREVVEQYVMEARSGDQFPPMVVFFDVETQLVWLADGFHRWHMYKELGYRWADCDVKFGTLNDAIAFAATANAKHGLRITNLDRKKSAFMLFGIPGFWSMSSGMLSQKTGVSRTAIVAWREEYSVANSIDLPDRIECMGGRHTVKPIPFRKPIKTLEDAISRISSSKDDRSKSGIRYRVMYRGKSKNLGSDIDLAKQRIKGLFDSGWFFRGDSEIKISLNHIDVLIGYFRRRGIDVSRPGLRGRKNHSCSIPGVSFRWTVSDLLFDGGLIRIASDLTQQNFSGFFGDALLASDPGQSIRRVVLCYPDATILPFIELARVHGVEFLNPEEFIESFPKLDAESA